MEIIPGLFAGSKLDAANPEFMRRNNIGLIVNITRTVPFYFQDSIPSIRVPIHHTREYNFNLSMYLQQAAQLIHATLMRGKNVLVHCVRGDDRAPIIVIAYLMTMRGMSEDDAIAYVKARKPDTDVSVFKPALDAYSHHIHIATIGRTGNQSSRRDTLFTVAQSS